MSLSLRVFTSPTREFGRHGQSFSPTTSTLVLGGREAVLVDAQYIKEDVAALGDFIVETDRTLTAIYVTHGHADHYFGIGELLKRFPQARALATAAVVADIERTHKGAVKMWGAMFGDTVVEATVFPEALSGTTIELEGHELRAVEVGQGDINPSTVLHIPSLDAVIAGDVAYNQIHAMLAFCPPEKVDKWIASLDLIAEQDPRTVVAGHKKPDAPDDDVLSIVDGTRRYLRDFQDAAAASGSAEELFEAVSAKYPELGNPYTLRTSAAAWYGTRP
jgi:glyoxylase-like metal-dependent hydrolase (beta-lactamase superfamily II)